MIRIRDDFESETLDCLSLFPDAEALDISSYRVADLRGIYNTPGLKKLWISRVWPKYLSLDFARLTRLKTLSIHWTQRMRNQNALLRLTDLEIRGCQGVEHLDLSGLRSLRRLSIGPAKGVETLSLEGVPNLQRLGLVLMPRLQRILGDDFFRTVAYLDIRGSEKIPREILSGFTRLRVVELGMRSKLNRACFGTGNPSVVHYPV